VEGCKPMAVRAASWAFLGLLSAVAASAGERPPAPAAADSFPVATDARLAGDESQTRFVMDFSRKIDVHAFTLADPYRVVVDIPQVTFGLPPKAGEAGAA
jgi:N-acetylmuramoyl-L-alanine amidase